MLISEEIDDLWLCNVGIPWIISQIGKFNQVGWIYGLNRI